MVGVKGIEPSGTLAENQGRRANHLSTPTETWSARQESNLPQDWV